VELTLLGQNVNAYHGMEAGESWTLGKLIRHIAQIDGINRIRYTTSHPRDMDDDLIDAHGSVAKLMPFLHLPVQSGSDRILDAMNRKHKAEEYLRIIEKLRTARPDIAFSSDFIVGFPGETEQDFEDTLALVREVHYAQAYSFKYSPRPGTPASVKDNQIPEEVKTERLARLQAVIEEGQFAFNRQTVALTMEVLFDRNGKHENQLIGRSPYMQSVLLNNAPAGLKDKVISVKIEEAYAHSVLGVLNDHD
jgi:tRNA-2-methylthio-N6-dimethylallyladenosine synthase